MGEINWEELSKLFPPEDLEQVRKYGDTMLTYIDANAIQRRLDRVVGPANWQVRNELLWDGLCPVVHCFLSLRVGEEWITRDDFGYPNNLSRGSGSGRTRGNPPKEIMDGPVWVEDGEAVKSASTDALRRAAWRWGMGMELRDRDRSGSKPAPRVVDQGTGEVTEGEVPVCPIHGKPFTKGTRGWYCKTPVKKDSNGKVLEWCKAQPLVSQEMAAEKAAAAASAPANTLEGDPLAVNRNEEGVALCDSCGSTIPEQRVTFCQSDIGRQACEGAIICTECMLLARKQRNA